MPQIVRLLILSVLCHLSACDVEQEVGEENREETGSVEEISTADGKMVYEENCLPCHAAGPGHPGTMQLAIRHGEEKAVLTQRSDLNVEYVKSIVRQGILLMPPFRPSEISDRELQALAEYLASSENG